MSTISQKTSIEELGGIISTALKKFGIDAFLSGGAVVSIYTKNKYESYDLDFISFSDRKRISEAMMSLGFSDAKGRHFQHPKTRYFVEFPGTAVQIGDEPITEFNEIKTKGGVLRLLTPTDCIKDRLSAYIHWKDRQGLEQAAMVAESHPFKNNAIKKFCLNEGNASAYRDFLELLKKK